MTADGDGTRPVLAAQAGYLVGLAARAPSVHNTQPWRFKVTEDAIELYADATRKLRVDALGREMLISCGAALFGLRLGVRSLDYLPAIELFPEPAMLSLLAQIQLGAWAPMTDAERRMLAAVPHRHTHRGPFEPGPLPAGLLPGLQHDAMAEGAVLALPDQRSCRKLAAIAGSASRVQDLGPVNRAEVRRWTRPGTARARDGVPAHAFAPRPTDRAGELPQRDFDLGRGLGLLPADRPSPPVTAVLLTVRDGREDWLRTGQALHRLLLHAASRWVFASLYTQPLESAVVRTAIKQDLALPGVPQILLQLGIARTTQATARRPAEDLIEPEIPGT